MYTYTFICISCTFCIKRISSKLRFLLCAGPATVSVMVEFPYSLREGDEARARDASLQTSVLILVCTPWLMIALLILRKLSSYLVPMARQRPLHWQPKGFAYRRRKHTHTYMLFARTSESSQSHDTCIYIYVYVIILL